MADWLRLWEMDRRLSNVTLESEEESPARSTVGQIASLIKEFDGPAQSPGEIRLLSSLLVPSCPRPLYVAILADWEAGLWLIAPYGRFTEPATPGELQTNREAAALRVLCLWNTHSVPSEVLRCSWLVDRMTKEEQEEAWRVFQHALTGKALPTSLEDRVGPPVFRAEDPRLEYQEQEVLFLAPLKARALEWASTTGRAAAPQVGRESDRWPGYRGRRGGPLVPVPCSTRVFDRGYIIPLPLLQEKVDRQELALAAADEAPAQEVALVWVQAPPVRLRFTLEGDGKTVSVWALDEAGEPSPRLNGATFLSNEGMELGTILDGQCLLRPDQIAGGLRLRTKEGKALKIKKTKSGK